ncbi:MarR family transcriptional regulator [Gordonia sp. L191]|uniref:MarR family winged helix-turn-helix transcriptional regulator n=1 Tax=Gordonia sp. L191 TaxID=2982699 RepID=UPI0024C04305|nr:MarR family transcriptional regulator [Gordonia sp. L191]WHU45296.1 MarR family transcriptional regulator [Gordonia sp. L191]
MSSAPNARAAAVEELSRLLNAAAAQLDSAVSAELDGLTTAQWHVLAALEGGTGRSMSELAAVTLVPGPSLTRLIDGMIDDNLVHRRPDETDRRRVVVFATRRGATLHSRSQARIARSASVARVIDDPDGPGVRLAGALGVLGSMDLTG